MAYTTKNYPNKKAMVEDFKAGKEIRVYQPGPFGSDVKDGRVYLEGPHYPQPHRWYAAGQAKDGKLVSIDGVKLKPEEKPYKPKLRLTCYDLGPHDGKVWLCPDCESEHPGEDGTVVTWQNRAHATAAGRRW